MANTEYLSKAKAHINTVRGKSLSIEERREAAISLAALILNEAHQIQTLDEVVYQTQLGHMITDPKGKAFITAITDQCFRSKNPSRIAEHMAYMIRKFGIPRYFSWDKKLQLWAFKCFGKIFSSLFTPLTQHMIKSEMEHVIIPEESEKLAKYLAARRKEHIHVNLNRLGEAILGEEEAKHRLHLYLEDLARSDIEYISVKISTLCSQLNLLAKEHTLYILSDKLRQLYRFAKENTYTRLDGKEAYKFVNLDMEEYRDLHLTVNLFQQVLNEPEFHDLPAGIVLQSYLPDSYSIQQELTEWAMKRIRNGGAPIKIRLVKGANLAMEQVEAAIKSWPQAPYSTKTEVDANFKRMMAYGCEFEHARAVYLGIGSHNLFEIAYALLLRAEKKVEEYVNFEMLEGMADHIRRAVQTLAGDMLLYCPVAREIEFQFAVAYLVRRLDENTGPDNFLRHIFTMTPGTKEWQNQAALFSLACQDILNVSLTPRRQQNRFQEPAQVNSCGPFENEPDTDWSLPRNREWADEIIKEWSQRNYEPIPLVIGGEIVYSQNPQGIGIDPSYPEKYLYRYTLAEMPHIEKALASAEAAHKLWSLKSVEERSSLFADAAHALRTHRSDLIGAMIADTGKTIAEADTEVSEAIDFAEYYRRNLEEIHCLQDIRWHSKGTVLVASPWNFPCSIPAGEIFASLAGGNSVIFKPAPEAILVGWQLVQILWEAGIGKGILQFIACEDDPIGSTLIKDPRIASVVLTGATATARKFLKMRPDLDLIAETGGKNTMIVSALSDRDLAIKDIIQSAFSHSGQKCSACSLVICEAEVYDDPYFRKTLRDAASSLFVGSPWNPAARVNPLISKPNPVLLRGLTTLEDGEEWLLQPRQDSKNPHLWSPGIKLGVKPGSFTFLNELFGPVLGVVRADNLEHAIQLANGTPYGLTAGLHSLDDREHRLWIERMESGNCYINRGITGAVVQRQPFGGCKQSGFGRGSKAGGPNYVMQLMHPEQISLPVEQDALDLSLQILSAYIDKMGWDKDKIALWKSSAANYAFFWNRYFSKDHDPTRLLGQDNLLRYVPHRQQTIRIQQQDDIFDVLRVIAAAVTCKGVCEISGEPEKLKTLMQAEWRKHLSKIILTTESDEQLCQRIKEGKVLRLRFLSTPNQVVESAAAEAGCTVLRMPVLANGRIELLYHLREVVLSIDYHRYGYLGLREQEQRKPLRSPEVPMKEPACGPQCCCV